MKNIQILGAKSRCGFHFAVSGNLLVASSNFFDHFVLVLCVLDFIIDFKGGVMKMGSALF
jgi:hypothetical protein